jgi:peptidoglycan/xylan/chitin deacetylase (PgdA/CDA1 family)
MLRLLAFSVLTAAFSLTACAEPAAPAAPTTTVIPAATTSAPEVKPAATAPVVPAAPTTTTPPPAAPAQPAAAPKITYTRCNVEGPYIAITFDDGPHGVNTPRLLAMLRERKIRATFFLLGECVAENPEVAKEIVKEGHEVGNHSWSHPNLNKLSADSIRDQFERTHNVITQEVGVAPVLMRPPYGNLSLQQRSLAHATWGYPTIIWDVDSLDWKHRNPAKTESIIMANTKPGSIILCHDIHKTTIDAMPSVLDKLLAKGFKFVTVSELIKMDREPVALVKPAKTKSLTVKQAADAATSLDEVAKTKPIDTTKAEAKTKTTTPRKTTTSPKKTAKG